uniref:Type III effector protein gala6 n=1 Tax=Ganoderma boninense TaxID=34458 RepID=A0A5K1JWK1_9APHY|nr:Type III effector protein gala6 [Ganoderma boninense]
MSQSPITLYDIQSTIPQPWAPNIWRVRYAIPPDEIVSCCPPSDGRTLPSPNRFILNYKRLPYRTVWIEFSDVETTLRRIGAQPTSYRSDGRPVYTLPAIIDPQRSINAPVVLSNPTVIAEYLEATYPARPVFPEGSRALQSLFVHYIQDGFVKPLLPILVPLTHQRLPERSQAHFSRGGAPSPTSPTALAGPQSEQAWNAVREQFNFLAAILDKNTSDGNGVVAMGRDVSYADFALCSVL